MTSVVNCQVALLGSTQKRVGKNALAICLSHGTFCEDETYEKVSVYSKSINYLTQEMTLQIHDTTLISTASTTEPIDVYLIVFSIYVQASFTEVEETIQNIFNSRNWNSENKNPIIIIAHDYYSQDEEYTHEREVTTNEITQLSKKMNVEWLEVNSKSGTNSNSVLDLIAQYKMDSMTKKMMEKPARKHSKLQRLSMVFRSSPATPASATTTTTTANASPKKWGLFKFKSGARNNSQ